MSAGPESTEQRCLLRVQTGGAQTLGRELGEQDVAVGVGVPEMLRLLTSYLCKGPKVFNSSLWRDVLICIVHSTQKHNVLTAAWQGLQRAVWVAEIKKNVRNGAPPLSPEPQGLLPPLLSVTPSPGASRSGPLGGRPGRPHV